MKTSCDEPGRQDLLPPVPLAQYKKRDHSTISTAMNQTRTYLVSAVIILSELGITDQPVFGRRTWHSYDAEEDKRSNLRHGP